MTIKDDLHSLIDDLDETDVRDTLDFLQARAALDAKVGQPKPSTARCSCSNGCKALSSAAA